MHVECGGFVARGGLHRLLID